MSFDKRTVTAKRLAANQAAAQKSTGPKTEEGKQRAAFNSFQHGAFAQKEQMLQQALARSGGDSSELDARREQLLADWQPASAQQELLVGDLAWLYWLRDQAATALVEGQERQRQRAELKRDERRFNARHRTSGLTLGDCGDGGGCVNLPDSEAKFVCAAEMLDELEARLAKAKWDVKENGACGTLAALEAWKVRSYLWGSRSTVRGDKVSKLWNACVRDKAEAGDERVGQIRVLLEEERAALAEEAELFRRRQEFDIEQPQGEEFSGLHPLGEAWQRAVVGIERLDRQINAKIRLLLRLQADSPRSAAAITPKNEGVHQGELDSRLRGNDPLTESSHGTDCVPWASPEETNPRHEPRAVATQTPRDETQITGTKPSEPLESTTESLPQGRIDE